MADTSVTKLCLKTVQLNSYRLNYKILYLELQEERKTWYNVHESNEQCGKNPAESCVVLARKQLSPGFFA